VLLPRTCLVDHRAAPPTQLTLTEQTAPRAAVQSGARFDPPGVSAGTILIAEDDASLADHLARLLAERYTVFVALDGHEALELVQRHQPQLLVTDVDMPGMTGIELSRRFRELTGDRLAPVVILSAVLDLRTRIAGLEAGASD
jgi:CheY-like chemotaxis protein